MAVKQLYIRSESGRYSEATLGEILSGALFELQSVGLHDLAYDISVTILDLIGYAVPPQPVIHEGQLSHIEPQGKELEDLVREGHEQREQEEAERARQRSEVSADTGSQG